MDIQLSMVGIITHDLAATLAFYRLLGLDIAEAPDDGSVVIHRMPSGVSMFFRPASPNEQPHAVGAGPELEFYVGTEAVVDEVFARLTGAGHRSIMAPMQIPDGPYVALVADPDGTAVLLSADEGAQP